MGLRTTLGLAALGLTALAPTAAATELTPGLTCENYSCRNDTDDAYRVDVAITCTNGVTTESRQIAPRTTEPLTYFCPPQPDPGSWEYPPPEFRDGKWEYVPPKWVPAPPLPQTPLAITYLGAVVDNPPGN
ncbi:hypothetical protein AB0H76_36685 [Nocardia sp. NPDC050712]|uniref:hypothetical protein n=1 Tax=Nocardia sp. NPDC050712 TaxID=3155518 RepID=UPI0033D1D712